MAFNLWSAIRWWFLRYLSAAQVRKLSTKLSIETHAHTLHMYPSYQATSNHPPRPHMISPSSPSLPQVLAAVMTGDLSCLTFRYPGNHKCTFDYKKTGREKIKQNNPVVMTPKIQKLSHLFIRPPVEACMLSWFVLLLNTQWKLYTYCMNFLLWLHSIYSLLLILRLILLASGGMNQVVRSCTHIGYEDMAIIIPPQVQIEREYYNLY